MADRRDSWGTGPRFCLLGPVQVLVGEHPVPMGGPGMRGVLAMLLLEPNQVVPLDRMVDVLWAHEPPASARTMVQGYVSGLRQRLAALDGTGAVRIATTPPGYRLVLDESLIDVTVARDLLAQSRGTSATRRAELLRTAQALWRGPELADVSNRVTAPELTELRLAVLEARFDADLQLGRHHEIIGELQQLVDEHPYRERLVGQLMLALYRSGRRATALAAYQRFAKRAAGELGMDPGPLLRGLHVRVLRDDTTLLEPSPEPVVAPRVGVLVPAQLPRTPSGFAGREDELAWLDRLLPGDRPREGATATGVLAGAAGVGKTALAVHWAHRAAERFPDGQLFAHLRGFDPRHAPMAAADVLTRFLLALGVGGEDVPVGLDDRAALYRSILADRRVLVVLDDARDAEQIEPLLPPASSSLVLVTTRLRLDALVARTGARLRVLGTLAADAAEQVLELIAGSPAEGRDRELRRRLARLCGHLPLALRIAGARLAGGPQWSVADLVAELADERGRLSALDLDDPATSVRAALDVTYRSLAQELADTVCLLGLFPGPRLGPYPVAALCGIPVEVARRRLRALAASFVVTEASRDVFLMHDLVRLHANELAAKLSEEDTSVARRRLLRYYLVGADAARRGLRDEPDDEPALAERFPDTVRVPIDTQRDAAEWIEQEWTNLLAVVESGLEAGQDEEIVQLARMASEFAEGTRTLGPLVLSRSVRLVV
ncbi:AfsR/SARP family transcriptional regulator [Actinophytocola gossypii]|uniref:SARP family transcriptional regulator n=1 Tax=Actinophytocola gossypii TaxID=2812003 RepID=A0ABT2J4V0_9PSEU|nr:BTAD domain-containing putative transcriptional regulator [Actinophytocola gossypii]MCT2582619.1 SARP family transcriptional regulator [Actinophytocola gossypii]